MPTIDPAEYVSIQNAARIMGVSRQHVHHMLRAGKIRGIEIEACRFALRSDCEKYQRDPNHPGRPREKPADGRD
jgi:predicted DNA-binding protein (UPF0251 family)